MSLSTCIQPQPAVYGRDVRSFVYFCSEQVANTLAKSISWTGQQGI